LNEDIKKMVQFQQVNLMHSFDRLGKFDVIMLRNVAIYFSSEVKIDLFRRMARCLNPGGYLFLGSSESLLGYSQDFTNCNFEGCNFYQVKPNL
jgi:chemotaxis protein methyltransferase CheR